MLLPQLITSFRSYELGGAVTSDESSSLGLPEETRFDEELCDADGLPLELPEEEEDD